MQVRNAGSAPAAFLFGSACHISIRVRRQPSDSDLYTREGGWFCAANLSGMRLLPGETRSVTLLLHGPGPIPIQLWGLVIMIGVVSLLAVVTVRRETFGGDVDQASLSRSASPLLRSVTGRLRLAPAWFQG